MKAAITAGRERSPRYEKIPLKQVIRRRCETSRVRWSRSRRTPEKGRTTSVSGPAGPVASTAGLCQEPTFRLLGRSSVPSQCGRRRPRGRFLFADRRAPPAGGSERGSVHHHRRRQRVDRHWARSPQHRENRKLRRARAARRQQPIVELCNVLPLADRPLCAGSRLKRRRRCCRWPIPMGRELIRRSSR